jgi:hypothetical protein
MRNDTWHGTRTPVYIIWGKIWDTSVRQSSFLSALTMFFEMESFLCRFTPLCIPCVCQRQNVTKGVRHAPQYV